MRKISKFSNTDRELVIKEIEKIQQVSLEKIQPYRKLYKSSNNLIYLIFGGTENWHSINTRIISYLKNDNEIENRENVFVLAKKYNTQIDIYVGSLRLFLMNTEKLRKTKSDNLQFHCVFTEDGLYLEEIQNFECNKVYTIFLPNHKRNVDLYRYNASLLNIDVPINKELTHTDIQAKLLLIGSYLNYRTYTPDVSKYSEVYKNKLGDISTEQKIPEGSIPEISFDTVKMIDVMWFDEEGYPTHAFEVEHTTDITKGLLRLYQTRKLRIKMFIISNQQNKFEKEVSKAPFLKIKDQFIFKNYDELEAFFESVKKFKEVKDKFGI